MPRKRQPTIFYNTRSAVGYVRVSTNEQAVEGVSLDAQEVRIRAYCAASGLDLVQVIREEGVSGGKVLSERPGGGHMLSIVGPNRAQHVIALKLDRLFRDAANALDQTRRWDHTGISLHLLDMGGTAVNTGSAMGRMMLTMMAAFAELERNLIAERTSAAMQHLKANRKAYSPTPLGYVRVGDDLVAVANEQATIRRIQDLHTLGWNYSRIARQLELDGVPTKNGGTWWPMTVRKIIRNDLHRETEVTVEPLRSVV